jgi:hypothetical protein
MTQIGQINAVVLRAVGTLMTQIGQINAVVLRAVGTLMTQILILFITFISENLYNLCHLRANCN